MDNNETTRTQAVIGIAMIGVIVWGTITVCEAVKNIGLDMVDKVTYKIKRKRS